MMQVEYPVYWTYNEFTDGFRKLLDHLQLDKVRGGGGGGGRGQYPADCTIMSLEVSLAMLSS